MATKPEIMTMNGGNPVANNQKPVASGLRGPLTVTREVSQQLRPGAVKSQFFAGRS